MLPFILLASLLTVICRHTDIFGCIKLQSYTSTAISTGAAATLFATATPGSTTELPVEYSVFESHGRAETSIATSRLMSVVDDINRQTMIDLDFSNSHHTKTLILGRPGHAAGRARSASPAAALSQGRVRSGKGRRGSS